MGTTTMNVRTMKYTEIVYIIRKGDENFPKNYNELLIQFLRLERKKKLKKLYEKENN